jgi:hypothetical protein
MTQIFNEFGVIVHEPTKALAEEITAMVGNHLQGLVNQGVPLDQIQAVTYWLSLGLTGTCSETVLRQAMKIRKQQRSELCKQPSS